VNDTSFEDNLKLSLVELAAQQFRLCQITLELSNFIASSRTLASGDMITPAENYDRLIQAISLFCSK
jgi:hypothetical protein